MSVEDGEGGGESGEWLEEKKVCVEKECESGKESMVRMMQSCQVNERGKWEKNGEIEESDK